MKKLLFNVVSVLILSICVLSCSKKDDENVTPINEEEILGEWTLSETVSNIIINSRDAETKKANDTIGKLFVKNDKYTFNRDLSCLVTRGSSSAPYPNAYVVDSKYLTFDGYIKFATNYSGNKLVLTAGGEEIKAIIRKVVKWGDLGIAENDINDALKLVKGSLVLTFTKN